MAACPKCGSKGAYVGLRVVECDSHECALYKPVPVSKPASEPPPPNKGLRGTPTPSPGDRVWPLPPDPDDDSLDAARGNDQDSLEEELDSEWAASIPDWYVG